MSKSPADHYFRELDKNNSGTLTAAQVKPFFMKSQLSGATLRKIWIEAARSSHDPNALDLTAFRKAFALIKEERTRMKSEKNTVDHLEQAKLVKSPPPTPKKVVVPSRNIPIPGSNSIKKSPSNQSDVSESNAPLALSYFTKLNTHSRDYLTADQCKGFFSKSGLPRATLSEVWTKARGKSRTSEGLDREAFCLAFDLIKAARDKKASARKPKVGSGPILSGPELDDGPSAHTRNKSASQPSVPPKPAAKRSSVKKPSVPPKPAPKPAPKPSPKPAATPSPSTGHSLRHNPALTNITTLPKSLAAAPPEVRSNLSKTGKFIPPPPSPPPKSPREEPSKDDSGKKKHKKHKKHKKSKKKEKDSNTGEDGFPSFPTPSNDPNDVFAEALKEQTHKQATAFKVPKPASKPVPTKPIPSPKPVSKPIRSPKPVAKPPTPSPKHASPKASPVVSPNNAASVSDSLKPKPVAAPSPQHSKVITIKKPKGPPPASALKIVPPSQPPPSQLVVNRPLGALPKPKAPPPSSGESGMVKQLRAEVESLKKEVISLKEEAKTERDLRLKVEAKLRKAKGPAKSSFEQANENSLREKASKADELEKEVDKLRQELEKERQHRREAEQECARIKSSAGGIPPPRKSSHAPKAPPPPGKSLPAKPKTPGPRPPKPAGLADSLTAAAMRGPPPAVPALPPRPDSSLIHDALTAKSTAPKPPPALKPRPKLARPGPPPKAPPAPPRPSPAAVVGVSGAPAPAPSVPAAPALGDIPAAPLVAPPGAPAAPPLAPPLAPAAPAAPTPGRARANTMPAKAAPKLGGGGGDVGGLLAAIRNANKSKLRKVSSPDAATADKPKPKAAGPGGLDLSQIAARGRSLRSTSKPGSSKQAPAMTPLEAAIARRRAKAAPEKVIEAVKGGSKPVTTVKDASPKPKADPVPTAKPAPPAPTKPTKPIAAPSNDVSDDQSAQKATPVTNDKPREPAARPETKPKSKKKSKKSKKKKKSKKANTEIEATKEVEGEPDERTESPSELGRHSSNDSFVVVESPDHEDTLSQTSSTPTTSVPKLKMIVPKSREEWLASNHSPRSPRRKSSKDLKFVRALYDYKGEREDQLTIHHGDILTLQDRNSPGGGWITATLNNRTGIVPASYVEDYDEESTEAIVIHSDSFLFESGTRARSQTLPARTHAQHFSIDSKASVESEPEPHTGDRMTSQYIAIFPYTERSDRELTVARGDRLKLLKKMSDDWYLFEVVETPASTPLGDQGLLPTSYVRQIVHVATATFDYDTGDVAMGPALLALEMDDTVYVTNVVNDDWWEGFVRDEFGLFPASYVAINEEEEPAMEQKLQIRTKTSVGRRRKDFLDVLI